MELKNILRILNELKTSIRNLVEADNRYKEHYKSEMIRCLEAIKKIEELEDMGVGEDIFILYQAILEQDIDGIEKIINDTDIIRNTERLIEEYAKFCYGDLSVGFENYKIKTIFWYEDEYSKKIISYMAGSFYTDQEYRAFLSNIQKGKSGIYFEKVEDKYDNICDLKTEKNGYLSRVKKAIDQNIQDGYHADFHLDNGRLFILRENENPIDAVYEWITNNTQAAVLAEWKAYLYNKLSEGGHIIQCEGINYTDIDIKAIILSEEVDSELIRIIRHEGLKTGEINIPREPVSLDPSMTFIDAMNEYIIPEITNRKTLYTVGDPFSELIESPIIFKKGNKIKKTTLFPKQKIISQGLLNGIKAGRNSLILNGGMGIGKTYTSIKLDNAIIKERFNKEFGRIAVYCQGHLIEKWERQFKECLPDVPLKFIKINNYKDIINLEGEKPSSLEVYLLPKDKVKRKYLEQYAVNKYKFNLSQEGFKFYEVNKANKEKNIFMAENIKISEIKVLARKLERKLARWTCIVKEVFDEDGNVLGYKVATTSDFLKNIYGKSNRSYDFYIKNLDEILKYSNELEKEFKEKQIIHYNKQNGLICPVCGGFLYDNEGEQFSEDEYDNNLWTIPSAKSDRNKKCSNYIKADGTPLLSHETKGIIDGEIEYFIVEKGMKYSYYDSDDNPIIDQRKIIEIKSGYHEEYYKIAIKKCETPHWTAVDEKGYRVVNSIDMLKRKFGKKFFDVSISDECHLYSAESSQGETFGKLCRISKTNIALTGTLTGGKASHLFYMLYRMIPQKMSKYYKYNEVSKFIDHYGRKKRVTKEYKYNDKYNKSGQGKITSSGWNEIPGISPMLYSHFLSDIMISRKIEDMNFDMPELKFYKHEVKMTEKLKENYKKIQDDFISFMKANKHIKLGGSYINTLLSYPDMPIDEPIMYKDIVISNPEPIDIDNTILPKEKKLIETIEREIRQGRRVLVYISYTGRKKVDKRIEKIIKKAGFKVAVLKSSVKTEKREQWIEDKYNEGVQVIITNPKLVQTGLDIIGYPTLYFYEIEWDSRVMRQAEVRHWRVGQDLECRVYYSYYAETFQFDALKLVGSKKKASLALEGVFAEDILSDMGDIGDTGAEALYKSLLGKVKLKEDDLDFFSNEEEIEVIQEIECNNTIVEDTCKQHKVGQLSLFTVTEEMLQRKRKKKTNKPTIGQISLFELS